MKNIENRRKEIHIIQHFLKSCYNQRSIPQNKLIIKKNLLIIHRFLIFPTEKKIKRINQQPVLTTEANLIHFVVGVHFSTTATNLVLSSRKHVPSFPLPSQPIPCSSFPRVPKGTHQNIQKEIDYIYAKTERYLLAL